MKRALSKFDNCIIVPLPSGLSGPGASREEIANMLFSAMAVRSSRVTIEDLEGVAHSIEVTAESLYEAVAQWLAALRRSDWVAGFQQGMVKVSVAEVRVEHQIRLKDFTKSLERPGRSPRDIIPRQKIRSVLGMPATR